MDKEKSLLIEGIKKHKKTLRKVLEAPIFLFMNNAKTSRESTEARKKGNDLFLQREHDNDKHREIFNHYCKSITTAPNKSEELALAFGNRSAFLLHLHRYQDCIKDIDKALKISTSNVFKVKMLCRKAQCLKKLGLPDHEKVLKHAKTCECKIKNNCHQDKRQAKDFIKKFEDLTIDPKHEIAKQSNGNEKNNFTSISTTKNPFEFVDIKYNQQFGRHLVAAKDYKPGEIIFVEDLYATIVNPNFAYMLCSYCLEIAWSGIPCEHCNWAMFCSETCKSKAWQAFHDVECSLISSLRNDMHSLIDLDFCVRLLVRAVKEVGDVSNLKEVLKEVDDCTDTCFKGFVKDNEFTINTIQSIYSLKSDEMYPVEEHAYSTGGSYIVVELIRHSNLLGTFDPTKIKHLLNNEDLIFLGALLMRFSMIRKHNCQAFSNETNFCKESDCMNDCRINSCCAKGTCVAPLVSLINNSCYPNASKVITTDRKVIVYAQRSIKRNSQIFISNLENYASTTLAYRDSVFTLYKFKCGCKACNQSWPALILSLNQLYQQIEKSSANNESLKYFNESKVVLDKIRAENGEVDDIEKLSKILKKAVKNLKEPSDLIQLLDTALIKLLSLIYGLNPLSFGQCQKVLPQNA